MTERYRPNTTVACIIQAQNRYLLVEERIDGQVKYNQPAGHLEAHESLISACIREVKEETGLSIYPEGLVGIYQLSVSESLAFVRYTFFIRLDEQSISSPIDPAINATKWLTYDEIVALKMQLRSPLVLKCIDDYNKGQEFPLSLLNHDLL